MGPSGMAEEGDLELVADGDATDLLLTSMVTHQLLGDGRGTEEENARIGHRPRASRRDERLAGGRPAGRRREGRGGTRGWGG